MSTIGENIKKLRKDKNMTQTALAEYTGENRSIISRWENDLTAPSLLQAQKICAALNVSLDQLARGEVDETVPLKSQDVNKDQSREYFEVTAFTILAGMVGMWGLVPGVYALYTAIRQRMRGYIIFTDLLIVINSICLVIEKRY